MSELTNRLMTQYPGLRVEEWHDSEGRPGFTISRDPNAPASAWAAMFRDMVANPATCSECGVTWNTEATTHDCDRSEQ